MSGQGSDSARDREEQNREDRRRDEERGPSIDKRKAIIGLVGALLLGGAALTGLGQIAHLGRLESALRHSEKIWIVPCLVGQLLAYLGYILAYHDAASADGGPRFDYGTTARIVVFGAGASVLGASVGGLAVDYWALRRSGTKPPVAARRVLGVGTIEWTIMSVYACSAALVVLVAGFHAPPAMALGWLLSVPACVLGALWFTSPKRAKRYVNPVKRDARPDHGRIARHLIDLEFKVRQYMDNGIAGVIFVRHLLSHPIRYKGGTIGYPIYWAGDMLTLYAAIRLFGGHVGIPPMIVAYCTGFVVSALPLPAGGAGGIEATITVTLHAIGVPYASAVLAVLTYRVITFWLPILPALALLPSIRRLHDALPSIPHSQRDADEKMSFRPA
ncbi:MAG TPA: lysylphosphatidylglycerol synthase transmembrane domain-containing protein [Solirubrobacteraceae bacterium]|nr:lysylphosphatidylglycerol synthase transmembrane domain-containing protein [Solirubrobacteraceae bacterium]